MCASMRRSSWWKTGRIARIAFERLEGCFDLDELQIELPELRRVGLGEIGAQQIPPLAAPALSELVAIEPEREACTALGDFDLDQPPRGRCLGLRGAELHQQAIAREAHRAQFLQPLPQPLQLPTAHRALLGDPITGLGEHIQLSVSMVMRKCDFKTFTPSSHLMCGRSVTSRRRAPPVQRRLRSFRWGNLRCDPALVSRTSDCW